MRKDEELNLRLLDFAAAVIAFVGELPKNPVGNHIANQLLRAATSPGANYEEACGAESRRDFCHKLGIVLKELKETRYWLRLSERIPETRSSPKLKELLNEAEELIAIFGKSISTARARRT
jgi:four helix bundle protein